MLPPLLESYRRKLASPGRDKARRGGSRIIMERLFQAMQRRFIWKLRSASVNPEYRDSIATGKLRDSLRKRLTLTPVDYKMEVYTSAKHYEFVDTGESEAATEPTKKRIKQWMEARLGISAGTSDDAVIEDPAGGGLVEYGFLVSIIINTVRERLESNFYEGVDLTKTIGEATEKPGGEDALRDLMDYWLSFYTIGTA